jgi:hypothetical protein
LPDVALEKKNQFLFHRTYRLFRGMQVCLLTQLLAHDKVFLGSIPVEVSILTETDNVSITNKCKILLALAPGGAPPAATPRSSESDTCQRRDLL